MAYIVKAEVLLKLIRADAVMTTTPQPQLNGNGGIVPRPEELASIGSTKAAELLLVKMSSLLCLPGAESFLPGPVALLKSYVPGPLLLPDCSYTGASGDEVYGIIPCVEC